MGGGGGRGTGGGGGGRGAKRGEERRGEKRGADAPLARKGAEAEARAADERHYGRPEKLDRDGDAVDTWFSSGLWTFSSFGRPRTTPNKAL